MLHITKINNPLDHARAVTAPVVVLSLVSVPALDL